MQMMPNSWPLLCFSSVPDSKIKLSVQWSYPSVSLALQEGTQLTGQIWGPIKIAECEKYEECKGQRKEREERREGGIEKRSLS